MVIKTKEFVTTKSEYYKILAIKTLRRIWWFYVFMLAMFALTRDMFTIIFMLLFTVFLMLYNLYFLSSRDNRNFYSERCFEIDDEFIMSRVKDGSEGKLKLSNVVRVEKGKNYIMIFVSKVSYFYIPLRAFNSPEDLDSLYSFLKTKIQESKTKK